MKNKLQPELKHLGLDAARPLLLEFFDTDYLHYGYWEPGLEVSFSNIKKAQERFVEILLEYFPKGTEKILDVGCGTGEVAKKLVENKFYVDCVSPSEILNEIARPKLGDRGKVYTAFFQNFESDERYDLILFGESFQYIPFDVSLKKAAGLLNEGGHILIADFFRKETKGKSPIGGGHSLKKFYEHLNNSEFEIIKDTDITDFTAPTIDLRSRLIHKVVLPLSHSIRTYFSGKSPRLLQMILWIFRTKIAKFKRKYVDRKVDAAVFKEFKSYRLISLKKKEVA